MVNIVTCNEGKGPICSYPQVGVCFVNRPMKILTMSYWYVLLQNLVGRRYVLNLGSAWLYEGLIDYHNLSQHFLRTPPRPYYHLEKTNWSTGLLNQIFHNLAITEKIFHGSKVDYEEKKVLYLSNLEWIASKEKCALFSTLYWILGRITQLNILL